MYVPGMTTDECMEAVAKRIYELEERLKRLEDIIKEKEPG